MIRIFALLLALAAVSVVNAQEPVVNVEWDAVEDSRVGIYVVGVGDAEGDYTTLSDVESTTAVIPDLGYDTYHISVKACKADQSLCSDWAEPLAFINPIDAPVNLREALIQLQGAVQDVANALGLVAATTE